MKTLRSWMIRVGNIFRKERMDRDFDDELSSHLAMHIEDNLRGGMEPEQARRDALLKLGGVEQTKENYRERRGITWIDHLWGDLRFGLRLLRKNPGFTAIAVLTLVLGIGANTAIFSVVNAVLLRSLPFSRSSELVYISARSTMFDFPNMGLSLPDIADLHRGAASFAAIAVSQDSPKELTGDGKPERIESSGVSEDFFPLLGIQPACGRSFTSSDVQSGAHVAVLSYTLWRERFGGDANAIGKNIILDGQLHTIIGVMPNQPSLDFATDSRLWTAFTPTNEQLSDRANHEYSVVARLKSGINIQKAQTELDTISSRLAASYPNSDKGWSMHATPLKEFLLGDSRPSLILLLLAVGLVLLIACANVSNLFLSHAWARRREFAVRAAVGATRAALLRQLAVECVMVALAGGAIGILVARWTLEGLRTLLPQGIPRVEEIRIDSEVAWFTLGVSILAALISGLAPALLSTRHGVGEMIKGSGGGAGASGSIAGHNVLRQLLVVGEVALAAVLLIAATLAVRSFGKLRQLNLGFRPEHVLAMRMDFPKFRYANETQAFGFVQQVLTETRAIPSVQSVSTGLVFPLSSEVAETNYQTEQSLNDPQGTPQTALANRVAPGFFQTLGIPLRAGRDFDATDAKGNPAVYIVNESLARKAFGSLEVVGKRIAFPKPSGEFEWGQIVGVSGNVGELNPDAEPRPQIYASYFQTPRIVGVYLLLRTKSDPLRTVSAVEDRIWSVDKNQTISAVKTIDAQIEENHASQRSQSLLLSIFGGLGFVLALVGVYGVVSYLVSLQTREIGIRMALGADRGRIFRQVVGHGLKLTLCGVLLGVAGGLALMRFMRSFLFGVSSSDPVTFAGVAILISLVALTACWIPARRATQVDPMMALRYE